ncbi:hypothetical protein LTR05_002024 [Lithohypha guttulata]|uniref:6-phosphogluconolactonase n=1 Tax=Lithohypha guttulata TaxID=1690604 RepID=A0AAN7YIH0_9EURO|nr:hypothetical protein LTR05_002024 [Lithohypha guttulata]
MNFSRLISLALCAAAASASRLFVSSYAGNVTSLALTEKDGAYSLTPTYNATECGTSPSWLTLDATNGLLFCVNEGMATSNGSLSSFRVNQDGSLSHVQNLTTLAGPVHATLYGNPSGRRGIVLAHYGSAISTYTLKAAGPGDAGVDFSSSQTFTASPGPVADRQNAPHPHQAILDPTGKYMLVPDLGTDQIRVFSYNSDNLALNPLDSLVTDPGAGPRHAAFWTPNGVSCENCTTFLYVVNEISGTVASYKVSYRENNAGLRFELKDTQNALGHLVSPQRNAPSEISVSPDNRFLLIGNRNDTTFNPPNKDKSATIKSDSISTFALNGDGSLMFVQAAPAYGSYPRHFSTNKAGNLIAVGLQKSSEVVVFNRDVVTGLIVKPVAMARIEGEVSSVVWNE